MTDAAYLRSRYSHPELEHRYGEQVHLLDDPLGWTLLARAGAPEVGQPEVGRLVSALYQALVRAVIARELPLERASIKTRMVTQHPAEAVYRGLVVARGTKVVTVGIARAGTMPSEVTYELLNTVLDPAGVRQDHLFMSRITDERGQVTGAEWHDAKIGRDVDDRFVLFPDPMGATGSSMVSAMRHYLERLDGTPRRCIAVNLIVTPEYLRRVTTEVPNALVYALRLDRGLSPANVLETIPGERWGEERGLDERQYIVPGAGGVGEVLNNAWI
ncbi:MAG: uracil phosphoribosyltransferase [Sorangiineae bacterium]|nr:uracil phosphoribosyltransferase [Polyangiaceae bacterium]MEB2320907.1 uracil phosphoribosyltransferase [Sorangiineae bacterium]